MKKRVNYQVLFASFLVVFIVAMIGNIFTSTSVNGDWYQSIKPSITPPNIVFPIVWTILYILIAISLYFSMVKSKDIERLDLSLIYIANFMYSIAWSFIFFWLRSPFYAFLTIILLWISIILMMIASYRVDKRASYLLIPYLIWVSFAIILNYLSIN